MVRRISTQWRASKASSLLMSTKLTCADLQKATLKRLELERCSKCDNFCNEKALSCGGNKRKGPLQEQWGLNYQCTGNGISVRVVNRVWMEEQNPIPSTPTPTSPSSQESTSDNESDSTSDNESSPLPQENMVAVRTADYKKRKRQEEEIDKLRRELNEVKSQSRQLSEENNRLRRVCWCHKQRKTNNHCAPPTTNDNSSRNLLRLDIELAATKRLSKKHKKTKAKVLLSMLQTGELFGDDSKDVLEGYVKQSARDIFRAWKIQKAIDTGATGGLNYGAIESLRKVVEELDRYERGILPSSSVIQDEAAALEEFANNKETGNLPYEKVESKNGECYKFKYECVVRLMLDAFGLTEIAINEGNVQISITLDGAELFDHASHLMGGMRTRPVSWIITHR
jgi:hypothetical protein